ncbi:MAG: hypothetical protein WCO98_10820, partial [bacterium]
NEGGIIREGCNPELDELRRAAAEGKNWIAELQAKEQARTGIKSLKIRFNNVFGYYIEISNSNKVRIAENPISNRLVASIGFQADCFIYDELNSQCGVNNDDYA